MPDNGIGAVAPSNCNWSCTQTEYYNERHQFLMSSVSVFVQTDRQTDTLKDGVKTIPSLSSSRPKLVSGG